MSDSPKKVPRIKIQQTMGPVVTAAIATAQADLGIDPADLDAQRRFFRAMVTLAAQPLFDSGCPAPLIAAQAFEAVVHEHQYRQKQGLVVGQPFGPTVQGKA